MKKTIKQRNNKTTTEIDLGDLILIYKFLFRKRSKLTEASLRFDLLAEMSSPAFEKSLSEEVLVAGVARNFLANGASLG